MTNFEPISLPAGWNAAQDCAYADERWEPIPSYTAALWGAMRFHYGNYGRTLRMTMHYYRRHHATTVMLEPGCLTPEEMIDTLREVVRRAVQAPALRASLEQALDLCQFAETERRRVLKEYRRAGEHAWMYPVVKAIDYLGHAALVLDEAMGGANGNYRAFKVQSNGWEE